MPSIALACYAHNRADQGFDYLKLQAAAARKAGSFHEYWTWEKYTGQTKPGGAAWYGETSAGFLDVLFHGMFGIASSELGFKALRIAPQFPNDWPEAGLELCLPSGPRLKLHYHNDHASVAINVDAQDLPIEIVLPWFESAKPSITGEGLANGRVDKHGEIWQGTGKVKGMGELRLTI